MSLVRETWVLSGPPGVGKTRALGTLAQRGLTGLDLDVVVQEQTTRSPAQLIRESGEPALRRAERSALAAIGARTPPPQVVALGGGTLTDAESRALARALGPVLGLDAPRDTLAARFLASAQPDRPLLAGGLEALLDARKDSYAACDRTVAAGRDPEQVGDGIVAAATQLRSLELSVGERRSRVIVGRNLSSALVGAIAHLAPTRPVLLLADPEVPGLGTYEAAVRAAFPTITVPLVGGEAQKTWARLGEVLASATEAGAGRQSVVVGLGGGATLDFAAMVAGLIGRGAPLVLVPTTLLAQADASIGGKAAVNVGTKNAVGLFWPATELVMDLDFLDTLPARELRSGLAEVLKAGVIGDPALFAATTVTGHVDLDALTRAIAVKAARVEADPYDRGVRLHLNLGHTLGHALEASGSGLNHGEAVAVGLAAVARVSEAWGLCSSSTTRSIVDGLTAVGLPTTVDRAQLDAALPLIGRDKKADRQRLDLIVIHEIGNVETMRVDITQARDALGLAGGRS